MRQAIIYIPFTRFFSTLCLLVWNFHFVIFVTFSNDDESLLNNEIAKNIDADTSRRLSPQFLSWHFVWMNLNIINILNFNANYLRLFTLLLCYSVTVTLTNGNVRYDVKWFLNSSSTDIAFCSHSGFVCFIELKAFGVTISNENEIM